MPAAIAVGVGLAAASIAIADPAATRPDDVWLRLDSPATEARREGPLDWMRVAGRAGIGQRREWDVVLAVDVSGSTALASGRDVDGDGQVGRARRRLDAWRSPNPRHLSSDAGDTVLAAELVALHRLVAALENSSTRFAVVSVADRATIESPLTSERARTRAALDELQGRFGSGLTNLADAIGVATALLPAADAGRERVMLLLSDGVPNLPMGSGAAVRAMHDAAREAGSRGVRIFSFDLGPAGNDTEEVFGPIATLSGGRHERLDEPGDVMFALPELPLATLPAIEVANTSTGAPARALRIVPDGSFDAYVPLVPGNNVIRVVALGPSGARRSEERRVFFAQREATDPEEARRFSAELARFHDDLQTRTVEAELALEMQARRAAAGREIVLEAESDPPRSP